MASIKFQHNFESETLELETINFKVDLTEPPLYLVIMLNDEQTTASFVIEVLKLFFAKSEIEAQNITLKIHNEGSAICGIYGRDIAESKVLQINSYARSQHFPLTCIAKPCAKE